MSVRASLPKGTRDFLPEQMYRRQFVIDTLRRIFEKYGYDPLETPSIEKLEVLSGKYGDEGEKLIFKVLKRGTGLEKLLTSEAQEFVVREYKDLVDEALRYDLTVPLSRVIAMRENELLLPFKRYQIQPVWRADRPQRGRYREFYQCDIDTVGTESMLADAEAVAVVDEALTTFGFENFKIRINNRKILNGILQHAGVDAAQATSVLIAIDKIEKIGLDGVKKELTDRQISQQAIERIFSILEISGAATEVLTELRDRFSEVNMLDDGARELAEMMDFLQQLGVSAEHYDLDLYLARGLGYYTGPIYEAVVEEPRIGSLTGGGRYDELIGVFLGRDIPATGVAFGIERIIDVMTQLNMFPETKTRTRVLVVVFDESTRAESLNYAQMLRREGIATECFFDAVKMKKQFSYADKKGIPFVAIIGPDEMARKEVTIKDLRAGSQQTVSAAKSVDLVKKVS